MLENTLGGRICIIRTVNGWTQEDLGLLVADYLGRRRKYTGPTVSRWETDQLVPGTKVLCAIVDLTGCSTAWLVYGT